MAMYVVSVGEWDINIYINIYIYHIYIYISHVHFDPALLMWLLFSFCTVCVLSSPVKQRTTKHASPNAHTLVRCKEGLRRGSACNLSLASPL